MDMLREAKQKVKWPDVLRLNKATLWFQLSDYKQVSHQKSI